MNAGGWTIQNGELREQLVKLSECDIMCISETHLLKMQALNIENYKWFGYNRQLLHKNAPKGSGGIGVFVNQDILQTFDVNVIDKSNEEF